MCPDLLDLLEGYEPDLGCRPGARVRFVPTDELRSEDGES